MPALPLSKCLIEVAATGQLTSPIPPMPLSISEIIIEGQSALSIELALSAKCEIVISGIIKNAVQPGKISALSQGLVLENLVTLFEIDLSRYGLGTGRFTPMTKENYQPLTFKGQTYYPLPVEMTGLARSGDGPAPRPKLSLANTNSVLSGLLIAAGDLAGCQVTRLKTFRRFLDDGIDPDPSQTFPPELWVIDRKVVQNKQGVEFELTSLFDQQGVKLPKRQVVKDYCCFVYRLWDAAGSQWLIDELDPCPYAGDEIFSKNGETAANPALDICGKKLRDCRLRFGDNAELPFRGFPGVSMVRR